MIELEGEIQNIFSRVSDIITGNNYDERFYNPSKIPENIFYNLGKCDELYESSKLSTLPEIYKKSIEWIVLEFKPKLKEITLTTESIIVPLIDNFQKLSQEFENRHQELTSYIIEQGDINDKKIEDFIKSKGLVEIKCIKCGDDQWQFSSTSPKDCLCHSCLKSEFEENKKEELQ